MTSWCDRNKPQAMEIWTKVGPYTIVCGNRLGALMNHTDRILHDGIPGAFLECGVWRGGCMMAIAYTLLDLGCTDRELYLFDTYEGMTRPEEIDVDIHGQSALAAFAPDQTRQDLCAPFDGVVEAMRSTGYPMDRVHFVQGDVMDTLPAQAPSPLALVHLDTDWYKSTRHELECLYPLISPCGVVIVDDYGWYAGSKKAVDDYFSVDELSRPVVRCDESAIFVKE